MPDLTFVAPGPLRTRTGGFLYDRRIVEELGARGLDIAVLELSGAFPFPSEDERRGAAALLAEVPPRTPVVVDGLALGALPEAAEELAARCGLIALVHHPLMLETGLDEPQAEALAASEARALKAAGTVITSSALTARWLIEKGWICNPASVVEPGTDSAPLSRGGDGETVRLLCVATLVPRKGHLLLLEALAGLRDRPWELVCAGAARDPETAELLREAVHRLDLANRVSFLGEVEEERLEALYERADLFVLASHHEGFGMVITEAVMRGLPVVATAGGAIGETLPPGCGLLSPVGALPELRQNLSRAISDKDLRASLRAATIEARRSLPSWHEAAARFAAACGLE